MKNDKEIVDYFGEDLLNKLPVNYRLMQPTGGEKRFIKTVESKFYQTEFLLTNNFYKPISKLPLFNDSQENTF